MNNDSTGKGCCSFSSGSLFWWTKLMVAVLAVPSLALIITAVIPIRGMGEVVVFVLACWISTYLGMKLMQNPKVQDFTQKK